MNATNIGIGILTLLAIVTVLAVFLVITFRELRIIAEKIDEMDRK